MRALSEELVYSICALICKMSKHFFVSVSKNEQISAALSRTIRVVRQKKLRKTSRKTMFIEH